MRRVLATFAWPAPRRFTCVGAGFFVLMCGLAVFVRRGFIYDEAPYLHAGLSTFDAWGITTDALRHYPQPAGLLFGLVHWLLRPVTHLRPGAVRAVNPLLLGGVIVWLSSHLRRRGLRRDAAWAIVAVPFIWVMAGLALTEMVGLFCAVGGVVIFLRAVEARGSTARASLVAGAVLSGVLIGLSFYSRPPLVLVAVPLALFLRSPGWPRVAVALAWSAAGLLVLPTVWLWRGLVSPMAPTVYSESAFSIANMVMSIGYGALAMAVIAPRWYRLPRTTLLAAFAAGVALNGMLGVISIAALSSIASRVLPIAWLPLYARGAGSVAAGAAAVFVVATASHVRARRHDLAWCVMAACAVLLLVSVGKITHQYSSRYTGVAAPFLVAAGAPYQSFTAAEVAALAGGAVVGVLALSSYLFLTAG